MPTAAMRPCLGNCHQVGRWPRGRCPACSRQTERAKGTASSRGYGSRWQAFRPRFIGELIKAGVLPICGAHLPGGPQTHDSQCQAEGIQNGDDLDFDHEPPLTDEERQDVRKVCDPLRIQLLCGSRCHAAKTRRQQLATQGKPRKVWDTDMSAQYGG